MNHQPPINIPARNHRQGELDLGGSGLWQQLPEPDRKACREALARLFYQTITHQPEEAENERQDPTPSL